MAAAFQFPSYYGTRGVDPSYVRLARSTAAGSEQYSGASWDSENIDMVDRVEAIITNNTVLNTESSTITSTLVGGVKPSDGTTLVGTVYSPFAYAHTNPTGGANEYASITYSTIYTNCRNTLLRNGTAFFTNYYSALRPYSYVTRSTFGENPQAIAELTPHRFSIHRLYKRYADSTDPSQDSGTYTGTNGQVFIVTGRAYDADGELRTGATERSSHGIASGQVVRVQFTTDGNMSALNGDKWYAKPSNALTYVDPTWTSQYVLQIFMNPGADVELEPLLTGSMGSTTPTNNTYENNYAVATQYMGPAGTISDYVMLLDAGDASDGDTVDTSTEQDNRFRVRKVWLNWRGTRTWTYLDSSGVETCGIGAPTLRLPGGLTNTITVAPTLTGHVTGNEAGFIGTGNNGRLDYVSVSVSAPGHFSSNIPFILDFAEKADEAQSTSYTDQQRLLDIEWADKTGNEWVLDDADSLALRVWPTHIRPMAMTWTVETPVASTESQSLVRYRRTMGAYRFKYKLKYPPMSKANFRPFLNHIMASKGGYREFMWYLDDGYLDVRPNSVSDNHQVKTFQKTTAGSALLFLDGLVPDLTPETPNNSVAKDSFILSDGFHNNGDIAMSVVQQGSNKFGEAVVRVSHPAQKDIPAYSDVTLDPTKIRVVLDLNSIDFDINTVELYGFEVDFIVVRQGDE